MRKRVLISDTAANSFRRIIQHHKEVSLIGGEDAKGALMSGLRRIAQNPMALSEEVDFGKVEGVYRIATVWDCLVLYKVEDKNVVIVDIILK